MAETCKGCGALQKEGWAKGRVAFRCMNREAGIYRGRVVDTEKSGVDPTLIRPAWCPRKGEADA